MLYGIQKNRTTVQPLLVKLCLQNYADLICEDVEKGTKRNSLVNHLELVYSKS